MHRMSFDRKEKERIVCIQLCLELTISYASTNLTKFLTFGINACEQDVPAFKLPAGEICVALALMLHSSEEQPENLVQ